MDSILLQKQIRDNSEEANKFFADIESWVKEMKRKEEQLQEKGTEGEETAPPIRSKVKKTKGTAQPDSKACQDESVFKRKSKKYDAVKDLEQWAKLESGLAKEEIEKKGISLLRNESMFEKELGNNYVKEQQWQEAIECYTRAINCYSYDEVFYANRALCYLKLNNFRAAETDCTTALQLNDTYTKAYQRRGLARVSLGLLKDAEEDFKKVLELEPGNTAPKNELAKLESKMNSSAKQRSSSAKPATGTKAPLKEEEPRESKAEKTPHVQEVIVEKTHPECGAGDASTLLPIAPNDDVIEPIWKPPHLRSKKSLKSIPVEEVDYEDCLWFKHKDSGQSRHKGICEIEVPPSKDRVDASNEKTEKGEAASKAGNEEKLLGQTEVVTVSKEGAAASNTTAEESVGSKAQSELSEIDLPAAPQTSVQFLVAWKRIRGSSELKYKFLKQIPGEALPHIFQDSLESREFSEVISSLENEFVPKNEPVYQYLLGFSNVKRFSALVMFMSKPDKAIIKKLIYYCEETGQCSKEDAVKLSKKYEIK